MGGIDSATAIGALKGISPEQLICIFLFGAGIAFLFVLLVLWLIKINMKAIDKIPEQLEKLTQAFYEFSGKSVTEEDVLKNIRLEISAHEKTCPCLEKFTGHNPRK